jgi:hypothetical protein
MDADLAAAAGGYMPLIIAAVAAIIGAVWGLLRWFALRLLRDIDTKLERIEMLGREVERVDAALQRLLAELPVHYQRRDDAIREYTAMNAKLDRVWETLLEIRNAR